jgi:ABC-type nitrate/sulfonate/bicarbonate transport system permease component
LIEALKRAHLLLPALLLFLLLGLWEGSVRLLARPDLVHTIYPIPSGIAINLYEESALLAQHTVVTLAEIGLGLALALVGGLTLALLIFYSKTLERALYPLIIVTQNIPVFAIAPLLVIWLGYGLWPKVIVAALIAFFPIVVNTVDGLRATDEDFVHLLTILGATPWQMLVKLRLPSALPFFFSGLKIGATLSVVGAVIGEWVGARAGLGYLMLKENRLLNADLVFAAIIWLSALGLALFASVSLLERLAMPWKHIAQAGYSITHKEE